MRFAYGLRAAGFRMWISGALLSVVSMNSTEWSKKLCGVRARDSFEVGEHRGARRGRSPNACPARSTAGLLERQDAYVVGEHAVAADGVAAIDVG